MDRNIEKIRAPIQFFFAYNWGANLVKERLQEILPKDGPESFEFLATQKVLTELGFLLTKNSDDSDSDDSASNDCNLAESSNLTQSKEPPVISATVERWNNYPSIYANALVLIRRIDPEKGAIGADYSELLLGLYREKFSKGRFFGLESIQFLCQYSIMNSFQQKQLMKSFLTGAEKWLFDNHWSYTRKTLDFVRMLDANHHSENTSKARRGRGPH